MSKGRVVLVGAGPGDPGLITVRGLECIRSADVVVYDYLAAAELLNEARPEAEKIYVGKKGGDHTLSQAGINDLIVAKAGQGRTVARLKGGDPFIFGRGGEEAEALIAAGLEFEVVPGVTSAVAAPAYAGIPLTHRRYTSAVSLVTGHEDPTKTDSSIDWEALAKGAGTLVFLMGVKNLPRIVERLTAHGRSRQTPVALVRWGTTVRQQTVTGSLETIVERVSAAGLKAPAVIVVGEVVRLREQMRWFEKRPLLGRRIVVTRARAQASDLVGRLSALGAECIEFPTIEIAEPQSWTDLDAAIADLERYRWVVFTSVNGVHCFFRRLFHCGRDARALGRARLAAIGPSTAAALESYGLRTDIVPETYRAESVVAAFADQAVDGLHVLLPRAAEARPVLPRALTEMGARVDEVPVYRTRPVTGHGVDLVQRLEKGQVDLVTFTSSSTVKNFAALLPDGRQAELMAGVTVASIGPITSDTARQLGFRVDVEAERYTIAGLCAAILDEAGSQPFGADGKRA